MCHPEPIGAALSDVDRKEEVIELADGATMATFVASPREREAVGSVLVIGDIWGARSPFYELRQTTLNPVQPNEISALPPFLRHHVAHASATA